MACRQQCGHAIPDTVHACLTPAYLSHPVALLQHREVTAIVAQQLHINTGAGFAHADNIDMLADLVEQQIR